MRRSIGGLALLAMTLSAGCSGTPPVVPENWVSQFRRPAQGPPIVQIDVALIERPIGDLFLNQDLWNYTDEQIIDLQQKAKLEENGLRVGQIIGIPPGQLQKLLTSERSCANPRRRLIHSGYETNLVLGPQRPETKFTVMESGRADELAFDKAQFQFQVRPSVTKDGKTKLVFTPLVEHGEQVRHYRPAPEKGEMVIDVERPQRLFGDLKWEVVLGANEFLIVGAHFSRRESLGFHAFIDTDGAAPVQRLLVIRTHRSTPDVENETQTLEDIARESQSVPLALQASLSTARGSQR